MHLNTEDDKAYTAWFADHHHGRNTLMLATTHDIVTDLNSRARTDRLARTTADPGPEVVLADGLAASVGDVICTRRNNPHLRLGESDWVRNGYRWTITTVHPDASLTATHRTNGNAGTTQLPADYVTEHVRLGYALTLDSAQRITVDTCHPTREKSPASNGTTPERVTSCPRRCPGRPVKRSW
ncbi:hypothetical protein [Nocardia kruczakiae]|uniref:hypothetical protein n=1 Tax=Nocardia kruczakiae TaxID=261477 RepID=UPI0007A37C27|nr:hypothetical protein [Nocardia kruczakiae]